MDSYDYSKLRSRVLDPLGPGGSHYYQRTSHNLKADEPVDPPTVKAAAGTVLVLDGLFLHRNELVDCWDFSVFLDVPFDVAIAHMAVRDGGTSDPDQPRVVRHIDGLKLYFAACQPWRRAHLVIDTRDLDAPSIKGSS